MDLNYFSEQFSAFENHYDSELEARAVQTRGEFLEAFPIEKLKSMQLDEYVIGLQRPTFCDRVEVRTRPWAGINGATALKFGVYFGSTKSDSIKKYRFAKRFGEDPESAFQAVRQAILDLVEAGAADPIDFDLIDENPLSQLFKAKILSLYFPDTFINVCSSDHLEEIGQTLGVPKMSPSRYQRAIALLKQRNPTTQKWSNPKFTEFLYQTIIHADAVAPLSPINKPSRKPHNKVNFEDIQKQREEIGKAAEEFALNWERQRLDGAGRSDLIGWIEDLRDQPGYGYDFFSYSDDDTPRYIEVKSVGKIRGEGYRFFLSENERSVSEDDEFADNYYFYLVFFGKEGKPESLRPVLARKLYQSAEVEPASFRVRFEVDKV